MSGGRVSTSFPVFFLLFGRVIWDWGVGEAEIGAGEEEPG